MGFLGGPRDPVGHFSVLKMPHLKGYPICPWREGPGSFVETSKHWLTYTSSSSWAILTPTMCTQYQSLVCLSVWKLLLFPAASSDPCEDYTTNLCLWLYLGMCTYVGAKLIFLTIFILSCFETGLDCFQRAIASSLLKGPASQLWSTDDPVSTQELGWHIRAIA